MQLGMLHLDDALEQQTEFVEQCERNGARHIEAKDIGARMRLWGRNAVIEELQQKLQHFAADGAGGAALWFMGSGDFHHVSALHIAQAADAAEGPITVLHFDNHPDWVRYDGGMHCGSWVNRAAAHPNVAKIITLGVCSKDLHRPEWRGAQMQLLTQGKLELFPYSHAPSRVRHDYGQGASYVQKDGHLHWRTIAQAGEDAFLEHVLTRINTPQVYLTIDKDVLVQEDAITNWDQGQMRLPFLLRLIAAIGQRHRIVGADVTGDYSQPHYAGGLYTRFMKHAEILLDQPLCRPCSRLAHRVNSASNHALLDTLQEVMA